jgi:hypothetical protein
MVTFGRRNGVKSNSLANRIEGSRGTLDRNPVRFDNRAAMTDIEYKINTATVKNRGRTTFASALFSLVPVDLRTAT